MRTMARTGIFPQINTGTARARLAGTGLVGAGQMVRGRPRRSSPAALAEVANCASTS